MTKIAKKKNGVSVGKVTAIGAGVAAVGAGAYYLLGPKGKQHQKKVKTWMAEMKMEVKKELKKVKSVTEPFYHNVVDVITATYGQQYKEHAGEINAFAKKLKGEWKNVQPKTRPVMKKVKSTAKKTI